VLVPCVVKDNSLSHASKCSSRGHDHTLSLDRIPNNILLLGRAVDKPGPADYIL
jgi:hypothetical protein